MIRQRNKGWQADVIIAGARHRKQFNTEAEAKAYEHGLLAEAARTAAEALQPAKGPTLGPVSKDAYTRFWANTKNGRNAQLVLNAVVAGLKPDTEVSSIDSSVIDAYIRGMQTRGCSPGTINRHLSCIRKLLKFCRGRRMIDELPVIEPLKEPEGRLRFYTYAEEEAVLNACETVGVPDFAQLICFLSWTGCRLGEALKLRWPEVDEKSVRFIITKNGKARSVPLSPELQEMLKQRRSLSKSQTVFEQWDQWKVNRAWGKVKKAVGITGKDAVMHTWRHTCASRLVQSGTCIIKTQKWLGHATITMTMKYAHLAPNALDTACESLLNHVTNGRRSVTGDVSPCQIQSQAA
jgi:integrase